MIVFLLVMIALPTLITVAASLLFLSAGMLFVVWKHKFSILFFLVGIPLLVLLGKEILDVSHNLFSAIIISLVISLVGYDTIQQKRISKPKTTLMNHEDMIALLQGN